MKPYPKYKDSGVEWIGEIPEHWDFMSIRRITMEHRQGYYSTEDYVQEGVKLIRITDLDIYGQINYSKMPFVKISQSDEVIFQVKDGDFLFPRTGSIGLLGVVNDPERAVFASYLINFRFESKLREYLKYYFLSNCFKTGIDVDLHGGVNKNIHAENIKNQFIALPPSFEQKAIASFLDQKTAQIDKLILSKQKLIELLKEERIAIINQAVTKGINPKAKMKDSGVEWIGEIPEHWEVNRITKCLDSIVDYRGRTPLKQDTGVFLVTARNIKNGKIDYSLSEEFVSIEEAAKCMSRGEVSVGDVLFTTEAPLGECANIDRKEICLAQRVIKFRSTPGVLNNYYLKWWINSAMFQQHLQTFATGSTALGIKASKLNYLVIVLPDIKEQEIIVSYIESQTSKIDLTLSRIEKEIELLQEYRTALISEVVTGKVKVT